MKIFGKDAKGQKLHFVGVGGIGMSGLAMALAGEGAAMRDRSSHRRGVIVDCTKRMMPGRRCRFSGGSPPGSCQWEAADN